MAKLEVVSGGDAGAVIELDPRVPCEVGSSRKCALRLRDPGVSFLHAKIVHQGEGFAVIDGRSLGTFLNGEKLTRDVPRPLAPGDVIRFGEQAEARFLAGGFVPPTRPNLTEEASELETLRAERNALRQQLSDAQEAICLREEATQDLGAKLAEVVEALMAAEEEVARLREELGRDS